MPREKITIFLPEAATIPDGFLSMVEGLSKFTATEVVRSSAWLKGQLLSRAERLRPIVIVVAPTKGDLESLTELKELFENTRLILVVADVDAETVSLGHLMRPRFMSYMTNRFGEIQDVVRKMVGRSNSGKSLRERRSWV